MIARTEWSSVCLRLRATKMRSERFCLLIFNFSSSFAFAFAIHEFVSHKNYLCHRDAIHIALQWCWFAVSLLFRFYFDWNLIFGDRDNTVSRSCIYFNLCNRFKCLDQKTIVSRCFSFLLLSTAVSVSCREKNTLNFYCTRSGLTVAQHLHHMTGSGTVCRYSTLNAETRTGNEEQQDLLLFTRNTIWLSMSRSKSYFICTRPKHDTIQTNQISPENRFSFFSIAKRNFFLLFFQI